MNLKKLISLCGNPAVSGHTGPLRNLVLDSRQAGPGDVFIAIKGYHSDGHQFIPQAVENGASAVIAEETYTDSVEPAVLINVKDTRALLGTLAHAFEDNPTQYMRIAGITGTNGKTTVATLIYQVLRKLNRKAALLGTAGTLINDKKYESRLTTPDAISMAHILREAVNENSGFASMEVSSHALAQERASGFDFTVAGFTNLSHDHLDYHKTIEEYAKAKKLLFDRLPKDAVAVVNTDDPQGEFMIQDCKSMVIGYGFRKNQGEKILQNNSTGLVIEIGGRAIKSPLIGEFNAYNLALAYHVCLALGCPADETTSALSTAPGAPGRMEKIRFDSPVNLPVALVDYAHTPDALKNILKTLREVKKEEEKIHVIFGAGGDRDVTKRPLMAEYAEEYADFITVTSDNPRSEDPEAIIDDVIAGFSSTAGILRESDREKAIIKTIQRADADSIVLIAGKGHETTQEVKGVFHHFDDKAIALKALKDAEKITAEKRRVH